MLHEPNTLTIPFDDSSIALIQLVPKDAMDLVRPLLMEHFGQIDVLQTAESTLTVEQALADNNGDMDAARIALENALPIVIDKNNIRQQFENAGGPEETFDGLYDLVGHAYFQPTQQADALPIQANG